MAWELARLTGDEQALKKIGRAIDMGLFKLLSWQVGGLLQNRFLKNQEVTDLKAIGGVMNSRKDPWLRIDVAQHEMHAVILARRYIFKE